MVTIQEYFGSKVFTWDTPRTRDGLHSIRVRFSHKEVKFITNRKLFDFRELLEL
jgi:hypothetical protein